MPRLGFRPSYAASDDFGASMVGSAPSFGGPGAGTPEEAYGGGPGAGSGGGGLFGEQGTSISNAGRGFSNLGTASTVLGFMPGLGPVGLLGSAAFGLSELDDINTAIATTHANLSLQSPVQNIGIFDALTKAAFNPFVDLQGLAAPIALDMEAEHDVNVAVAAAETTQPAVESFGEGIDPGEEVGVDAAFGGIGQAETAPGSTPGWGSQEEAESWGYGSDEGGVGGDPGGAGGAGPGAGSDAEGYGGGEYSHGGAVMPGLGFRPFAHGGAVMPGLGFRPLHYQDGTGPEGVEKPSMTHENALLYIKWLHGEGSGSLPPNEQMSLNNFAEALEIWQRNPEAAVAYATRLQALIGAEPGVQKNITARATPLLPPGTGGYEMRFGRDLPTTSDDAADAYYGGGVPGPSFVPTGDQTAPDFREIAPAPHVRDPLLEQLDRDIEQFDSKTIPPGNRTAPEMEGNIPRFPGDGRGRNQRGLPSWMSDPRFKGYYNPDQMDPFFDPHNINVSGGGYVGRGMRHGGMMSKRHQDPDWYRHMRGGLGSLSPRRRKA